MTRHIDMSESVRKYAKTVDLGNVAPYPSRCLNPIQHQPSRLDELKRIALLDDLKRALFETPYDAELFVAVDTALVDYLRRKRAKPAWEQDVEGYNERHRY